MPAVLSVDVPFVLTNPHRQRPHLRLRRRSRTQRERIRQPLIPVLRQLRDLRTPLGARRAEIRSEFGSSNCNHRLERRHDRDGILP